MVHTMTITYNIISLRIYSEIIENLKLISKEKGYNLYPNGNEYVTHAFSNFGMKKVSVLKRHINSKYQYPYMKISINLNPAILIGKGYEELINEEDLDLVEKVFDTLIKSIHKDLPRLMLWSVNRIDYAINITTEYVEEYIKLFQKGDKPFNFEELYCKKSRRRNS